MAKQWDPVDEFLKLKTSVHAHIKQALQEYKKPHCHLTHNKHRIEVEIKLPDVHKKDIEIDIQPRALLIRAEKKEKTDSTKKYFSYFRKIPLSPGFNTSQAQIRFFRGTLVIKIPRKEQWK